MGANLMVVVLTVLRIELSHFLIMELRELEVHKSTIFQRLGSALQSSSVLQMCLRNLNAGNVFVKLFDLLTLRRNVVGCRVQLPRRIESTLFFIFFSIARTYSQSSIADAFRAVLRFTRFCSSTSTLLEPVTISKVARFLGDVQDGASNRSKPHCGLAADGVIKGLARAAKLVNAPFPQTILSDFQIQAMSVAIDASRDPREFGMSLALVCSLEDIALGEFWNQARAGKPMPSANEFEAWTA